MKDLVVKILTVLFVISLVLAIPVAIIKGHVEGMTLNATYMNKTDHGIKMKFTKDVSKAIDSHVVFLYVDGKEYRGNYRFEMGRKFEKYVSVSFNEYPEINENGYSSSLNMRLRYSKKKITVVSSYGDGVDDERSPFALNQIFIKKTWWNTWGKKFIITLIILFVIWRFKDVFKMLKDKDTRQKIAIDLIENLKKGVNNFVEAFKVFYNSKNGTNKS